MLFDYRFALALGLSALLLAGCGDSSDSNNSNTGTPDIPAVPDPVVIPPPHADAPPDFIVQPYLQAPSTDTMTVMFETKNSEPQVWARSFGSNEEFRKVAGETHSSDGLVYRAPLTELESNTLYEYYVLTKDAEGNQRVTQPFAFKTWPNPGDGVSEAKFIAISDTQLDRAMYEVVLNNVVADGFMTKECDRTRPETCAENIAAITISGDVVQTGSDRTHWREQLFGRMAEITPYVPLVTVPGNHDYYGDAELELYRTYMAPPANGSAGYEDHWYFLDYLDLRLIGLDSYPISGYHGLFNRETLAIQRQWLRETLKDAEIQNKTFVMGMFHHGCLSEMWNSGESVGSCELVSELEQYSARTGAVTGHFFGHTHSYSRGQSMDSQHLWLNAASVSGYIEPLNDPGFQNGQISDYETFEVSRSEFGYSVLTYQFDLDPSVTLRRKKGGYNGDTDFEVVDKVTFAPATNNNLPQATSGTGELAASNVQLAVQVGAPDSVHEVHWQIAETENFSGPVFDIWGNDTRRHNFFYDEAPLVGGDEYAGFDAIDTQQGVNLLKLDLSSLLQQKTIRLGGDDHYRWNKRFSGQNTHVSTYDEYQGRSRPNLRLKPGTSYYWKARVRDKNMNWSVWSNNYKFNLEGSRTANLLVNGDAETGDLTGWTIASGSVNAVTGVNDPNVLNASEGDYYFTGRGFGNAHPTDCCTDTAYQVVDVSGYQDMIDSGKVYIELGAKIATWNGVDEPELVVELLDANDNVIPWSSSGTHSSSSIQSWETVTIINQMPAGVRSIKVYIGGTRHEGNDNDVYFDDLYLNLLH
ncbi:metallophosphoesterase [Marinobacter sp. KMM 10035]|uniref:metallophosphoesterase n=1 Tax=Marinobacter sp. KMM 10035 TaxID=3134034 RepID=UPI00397D9148